MMIVDGLVGLVQWWYELLRADLASWWSLTGLIVLAFDAFMYWLAS